MNRRHPNELPIRRTRILRIPQRPAYRRPLQPGEERILEMHLKAKLGMEEEEMRDYTGPARMHNPISKRDLTDYGRMSSEVTVYQLAMEPGREMDALVAEKVLGMTIYRKNGGCPFIDHGQFISDPPKYSADIYAAWEVVEKLKIAIIPQSIGAPKEMSYLAEHEYGLSNIVQAFAETAPLAICRAALISTLEV